MKLYKTLDFLRKLEENNNKEWFAANRNLYKEAKKEFEDFVRLLIEEIKKFSPEIGLLEPKQTLFRINRDTRFSKDKRPYKNFFGSVITKGGRKSHLAGYYVHIQPENSFLGGGIYCSKPEILKVLRNYIFENYEKFLEIINDKKFNSYFEELYGEKLKRLPRGFPADFPYPELLKYKNYAIAYKIKDDTDTQQITKIFKIMKPFNDFLNKALMDSKI